MIKTYFKIIKFKKCLHFTLIFTLNIKNIILYSKNRRFDLMLNSTNK